MSKNHIRVRLATADEFFDWALRSAGARFGIQGQTTIEQNVHLARDLARKERETQGDVLRNQIEPAERARRWSLRRGRVAMFAPDRLTRPSKFMITPALALALELDVQAGYGWLGLPHRRRSRLHAFVRTRPHGCRNSGAEQLRSRVLQRQTRGTDGARHCPKSQSLTPILLEAVSRDLACRFTR